MIGMKDSFADHFTQLDMDPVFEDVVQTLTEDQLIARLPSYDGWIIGDDPASRRVLAAGRAGNLRAAVKWGVGIDNVDFDACRDLGIAISHTPGMFGREVADIALGYIIGLARHTYRIDREIREKQWPKYRGSSLFGKRVGLVGFGDIGSRLFERLEVVGCSVTIYDPYAKTEGVNLENHKVEKWPNAVESCDFLVLTCALTNENRGMLSEEVFATCTRGIRIVNVSRGGLIDQAALVRALKSGQVAAAALDVFDQEPPTNDELLAMPDCIFGSHNASNTEEAVLRTSYRAIDQLAEGLSKHA